MRYTLLGLFHASSQAKAEGKPLIRESVHKIRERADGRKLEQARRMLANFLRSQGEEGGEER